MIILKSGIALILTFLMINNLFAQEKDQDWEEYVDWAWKGDFKPYFEFSYGYAEPMHKLFDGEFARIGAYEVKVGYSDISPHKGYILGMDERYLFGSYYKDEFNFIDDQLTGVTTEAKRFGFGNRLGFGYDIGPLGLLPYSQIQYVWTQFNPIDSTGISTEDSKIIDRYAGVFRFGHSGEAGVKVQLFNSLSVSAGYEFAVIYPRHIFWPWLGSHIIQSTALGMISVFSEDIVNSSPIIGPIMYFVLRNGVAYVMYQGYKDKMNWPFESETPVTMETLKISASITF
jgi:hypothetical protein